MENKTAVRAFVALGSEPRLNIFRLVVQRGATGLYPCNIQELLGIPGATLSFHLKELVSANLLSVERQGRNLLYRPNAAMTSQLVGFLVDNCCGGKPCGIDLKSLKKSRVRT